ncbi:MAG TPA: hypothetical protein DIU00_18690 [Phycisphaerales bacterium]|nr:hypothetical protein [Phycisphaerales bacterium]
MKSTKNLEQSIKKLTVESRGRIHDRILQKLLRKLDQSKRQTVAGRTNVWIMILKSNAGKIAAAFLIISSWAAFFVMSGKVKDLRNELEQSRRDVALAPADDSATINFYLEEHRDLVARHASASPAAPQPVQMRVSPHDILYYESFDDEPEYMSPGIIVRGPSSQNQIGSPEAPVISNGHTLTLSEARKTADFELHAPARLFPGYSLEQIRRIEGRDAMQLLYTDGINSVSLFEQPLDGQRGLSRQDFREYAVYRNKEQAGGTILAWRDDVRSYVLIGNTEMSQLMDMAQSISAGK